MYYFADATVSIKIYLKSYLTIVYCLIIEIRSITIPNQETSKLTVLVDPDYVVMISERSIQYSSGLLKGGYVMRSEECIEYFVGSFKGEYGHDKREMNSVFPRVC